MTNSRIDFLYLNEQDMIKAGVNNMAGCVESMEDMFKLLVAGDYRMGGDRRLSVSTKKDIVLGPYFVMPLHKGKGYAKMVVKMTLEHCSYDYEYAFDWIHETNIPQHQNI